MKKVLLGTAAIFAMSGASYAAGHAELSISLSGGADIGVRDLGGDTEAVSDINLDFSGSGETDGGLGFGFTYTILSEAGAGSSGGVGKDDHEVFISGSWGKLTVGDPDDALQSVAGIGDIGFRGLAVDDLAELGRGIGASDGILYSNSFGAVSVFLSHGRNIDDDDAAIGVSFDAGPVTIGVGYEDTDAGGAIDGVTAVDLSGSFGAFGFDILVVEHDISTNVGAIFDYTTGPTTLSLGFADSDGDVATLNGLDGDIVGDTVIGVGFAYDLGGGATLEGGVADNEEDTIWDLGIEMTF